MDSASMTKAPLLRSSLTAVLYAIAPRESHGMLLAGIYRFENNKPVFTILTRSPSEDIAMIHDRMPVILPQEALADWLNPHYSGSEILSAALTSMSFHAC